MDEYRKLVDELFRTRSNKIIANSSDKHAAVLFESFFKYAKEEICIFCENLNRNVFNDEHILKYAKDFLERPGTKLYIGLTEAVPDSSDFLKMLSDYRKKDATRIRVMHFPKLVSNDKFVNFAVMDSCGYRFEPDYKKCEAIAAANDAPFAMRLRNAFMSCLPPATSGKSSNVSPSEG